MSQTFAAYSTIAYRLVRFNGYAETQAGECEAGTSSQCATNCDGSAVAPVFSARSDAIADTGPGAVLGERSVSKSCGIYEFLIETHVVAELTSYVRLVGGWHPRSRVFADAECPMCFRSLIPLFPQVRPLGKR